MQRALAAADAAITVGKEGSEPATPSVDVHEGIPQVRDPDQPADNGGEREPRWPAQRAI